MGADTRRSRKCTSRRRPSCDSDLVYPPQCVFCVIELAEFPCDGVALCDECRAKLAPLQQATCSLCGAALDGAAATVATTAAVLQSSHDLSPNIAKGCRHCRELHFAFGTVVSHGRYRGELREAVLRMKHPSGDALAIAMARCLARSRHSELAALSPDLVIPIPMHWSRRMSRGANSSELLAHGIAKSLGVRHDDRAVVRFRRTRRQTDLLPEQRPENIRGAFKLRLGRNVAGVRVLLVDDVLTTGATANEVAALLLKHGAAAVTIAVLARADLAR